jgi:hypothetical protein
MIQEKRTERPIYQSDSVIVPQTTPRLLRAIQVASSNLPLQEGTLGT